jgi:hypothetical protein
MYSDPSGEIVETILISLAVVWFFTSDTGYEIQKYISPIAFHINIHLSGQQKGIGFDVSVGIPKTIPISYRAHAGATYYWNHYDGSYSGWEKRYGGEWTLFGLVNYSGTTFISGETSQTTNMITLGVPLLNFKYENDFMWGIGEYIPGVPAADGGDRYRTSGVKLTVGPFPVGMNLFTGDPGLDPNNRPYRSINGHETYVSENGTSPNKYRAGVLYLQIGPIRIGRNTEGIRHLFQNRFAHDYLTGGDSKWFEVLDRRRKWYFYFGGGTGGTLW